jgi:hypothetical protein
VAQLKAYKNKGIPVDDINISFIRNRKDGEPVKVQERGQNTPASQKRNDGFEPFVQSGPI